MKNENWIFSHIAGVYTLLRSRKRSFFFRLFIRTSHFDRPCKDGLDSQEKTFRTGQPGQPGQDIQDRTVSVGFEDRAPRTEHVGQDR